MLYDTIRVSTDTNYIQVVVHHPVVYSHTCITIEPDSPHSIVHKPARSIDKFEEDGPCQINMT